MITAEAAKLRRTFAVLSVICDSIRDAFDWAERSSTQQSFDLKRLHDGFRDVHSTYESLKSSYMSDNSGNDERAKALYACLASLLKDLTLLSEFVEDVLLDEKQKKSVQGHNEEINEFTSMLDNHNGHLQSLLGLLRQSVSYVPSTCAHRGLETISPMPSNTQIVLGSGASTTSQESDSSISGTATPTSGRQYTYYDFLRIEATFGSDRIIHPDYDRSDEDVRPQKVQREYRVLKSLGDGAYGALRLEEESQTMVLRALEVVKKKAFDEGNFKALEEILLSMEESYKDDDRFGAFLGWFENDEFMFFAMDYKSTN